MSKLNYITNTPLPNSQDFETLKAEGLAYIQQYGGSDWTNLNASDPGVTILDQICYALTELGYCNDFSIADILTEQNGKLKFKNQFFFPENILTTSPLTINDYRKYCIDGVDGISNVIIIPSLAQKNTYKTYIQPSIAISGNAKACEDCCNAAFNYLNKSRNLGELFTKPELLKPEVYLIAGRIDINDEKDAEQFVASLQQKIRQFILSDVSPLGYTDLVSKGYDINDIFNGPLLKKGWIPTAELGNKKDKLTIIDIINLINAVPIVSGIANISFASTETGTLSVSCTATQIITIDVQKSINDNTLQLYYKGRKLSALTVTTAPAKLQLPDTNIYNGAQDEIQTKLPQGTYRDINSYYSIQNTFPQIYGVGEDGINSSASTLQIAQSRQLKGYLTLFDQIIANQFSQLANVDKLFSFTNSISGTPSDTYEYYAVKDVNQKANPQYPVPYVTFSPTYFYQTLYDVPNIKPLLKDNFIFDFSYAIESNKEKEVKDWKTYKEDPYNPYAWGLMQLMEDEGVNLQRRNDLLDHLLARHGESPEVMKAYIEGSVFSGNSLKDMVIFKSLYLQNLDLLSYNRNKSYNYLGANEIKDFLHEVIPTDFEYSILGGHTNDFIFNSNKIDRAEKLHLTDFINYTTVELKLNLLLGLKMTYKDFIAATLFSEDNKSIVDRKIAYWLIKQRKGLIFIELPLLVKDLLFSIIITNNKDEGPYYIINSNLSASEIISVANFLAKNTKPVTINETGTNLIIGETTYPLQKTEINAFKELRPISGGYYYTIATTGGNEVRDISMLTNKLLLLFPDFVPSLTTVDFNSRLTCFLDNTLPLQIAYTCSFLNADFFKEVIRLFAKWHNSIIYKDPSIHDSKVTETTIIVNAESLFSFLNTLHPTSE